MITLNNPLGLEDYIIWLLGIVAICYALKKRYPWTLVAAFGFTAFSALRIYQNSLNGIPMDVIIQQFDTAAEGAMISFLLTVMIAQSIPIKFWIKIFRILAVANAAAICADFLFFFTNGLFHHLSLTEIFQHEPWGLLLNASMSGCLNAALFPLFDKKEKFFRYFIIASVILAGRSLPVAVLFTGIGASLLIQKRYKELLLAVPASFALGFLIKGTALFAPRGRDLIWTQSYFYFRDHLRWLFGSGLGGFYVVGPVLTPPSLHFSFIWLHSDWLQVLFEQGILGFVLVVLMYADALRRARATPQLFSALAAYAAFGAANMPLRYPLSGLLGAFLIRWAMEKTSH